jgi:hypothetical protein
VKSHQVGKTGGDPALGFRDEGKHRELVLALDPTLEAHAPHLLSRRREAELGEGDAQLDGPAARVDGRRCLPDRIPGSVLEIAVAPDEDVLSHAGRVHDELERRPMIVIAVQPQPEFVAVR